MRAIDVLKYLLEKAESETPEGHRIVGVNVPVDIVREIIDTQPERENEPVGCNGCRYDWFGDPRCNRCARSFQDYYEADKRGEKHETD